MKRARFSIASTLSMLFLMTNRSHAFSPSFSIGRSKGTVKGGVNSSSLNMGLFDGISKAFTNQEFQAKDRRVRASHILIKGDDIDAVFDKMNTIQDELNERVSTEDELASVFCDLAQRESQCPSSAKGGDLGLFGPGKMVKEFDEALFPTDDAVPPPPVGSVVGPVVTEFGCHVILVTQRGQNKDQVEEMLANLANDW